MCIIAARERDLALVDIMIGTELGCDVLISFLFLFVSSILMYAIRLDLKLGFGVQMRLFDARGEE